jgi:uncharacterized phiE125 gp8 family phage protein
MLRQIAQPIGLAVDLAVAKEWIGVRHDDLDTSVIEPLLKRAIKKVEDDTERAFYAQTWRLTLDDFPRCGSAAIELNRPHVESITAFSYIDGSGAVVAMVADDDYQTSFDVEPGVLLPPPGGIWPSVQTNRAAAVVVDFVAGKSDPTAIDIAVQSPVLLLFGHWFYNRGDVGKVPPALAESYDDAIEPLLWTAWIK